MIFKNIEENSNLVLLTPNEVADLLKINYRKVLEIILMGDLKAFQVGRQYRVPFNELKRYLDNNTVEGFPFEKTK